MATIAAADGRLLSYSNTAVADKMHLPVVNCANEKFLFCPPPPVKPAERAIMVALPDFCRVQDQTWRRRIFLYLTRIAQGAPPALRRPFLS